MQFKRLKMGGIAPSFYDVVGHLSSHESKPRGVQSPPKNFDGTINKDKYYFMGMAMKRNHIPGLKSIKIALRLER